MRVDDLISSELKRLEHDGRLTPEAVVRAAGSATSPLHDLFEWDTNRAAHAYRLEQARHLIRSVRVVLTTEKCEIASVYYVRDPSAEPKEQGYVALASLRDNPVLAAKAVRYEFMRAQTALQRAEDIAEILNVKPAIANARKILAKANERVDQELSAILPM